MFEHPGNSTVKYLLEAKSETELFSVVLDLLSSFNIGFFLVRTSGRNQGLPVLLMHQLSERTIEILRELSSTKRDPISRVSENNFIPCDLFKFREDFTHDKLAMDLFRRLDSEGVNPFYLFSFPMPGSDRHIFCVNRARGEFLNRAELTTLQGIFLYVSLLRSRFIAADEAVGRIAMLTKREREVLWLMAQGYTDREIGQTLDISLVTVGFHVKNAKLKLGARNKCHAVFLSGIGGSSMSFDKELVRAESGKSPDFFNGCHAK